MVGTLASRKRASAGNLLHILSPTFNIDFQIMIKGERILYNDFSTDKYISVQDCW